MRARKPPAAKVWRPWIGIRADGWIDTGQLETHDLGAGSGEAQSYVGPHNGRCGRAFDCLRRKQEVDINWQMLIQPPARMPIQGRQTLAAGGALAFILTPCRPLR